jgi:hypothetical protein
LRDGSTERSRARGVPQLCQIRSLHLDRSKRRLRPNPIRSGTFCRKLVVMHGRRCHPPGVSDKRTHFTSSPAANHASVAHQGRFRHPSAKKDTIRRTQGAFHRQISLIEACLAPPACCRQPVKGYELRLFDPRANLHPDGGEEHENSAKSGPFSTSAEQTTRPQRLCQLLRSEPFRAA